jgi:hypothetical protein
MHRATRRFWECFDSLAADIQNVARKNYALLKGNPRHPSLQLKKLGTFWSARVGLHHRALASRTERILSGCGLVPMMSMNASSNNDDFPGAAPERCGAGQGLTIVCKRLEIASAHASLRLFPAPDAWR